MRLFLIYFYFLFIVFTVRLNTIKESTVVQQVNPWLEARFQTGLSTCVLAAPVPMQIPANARGRKHKLAQLLPLTPPVGNSCLLAASPAKLQPYNWFRKPITNARFLFLSLFHHNASSLVFHCTARFEYDKHPSFSLKIAFLLLRLFETNTDRHKDAEFPPADSFPQNPRSHEVLGQTRHAKASSLHPIRVSCHQRLPL